MWEYFDHNKKILQHFRLTTKIPAGVIGEVSVRINLAMTGHNQAYMHYFGQQIGEYQYLLESSSQTSVKLAAQREIKKRFMEAFAINYLSKIFPSYVKKNATGASSNLFFHEKDFCPADPLTSHSPSQLTLGIISSTYY